MGKSTRDDTSGISMRYFMSSAHLKHWHVALGRQLDILPVDSQAHSEGTVGGLWGMDTMVKNVHLAT